MKAVLDQVRFEVAVSPRLAWLFIIGGDEQQKRLYEMLALILERYDIGPKQQLVFHCPARQLVENGPEEKLSIYISMPHKAISVAFHEEVDWEAMKVYSVASTSDGIESVNAQLRQMRRAN
jgi:hypothetical protein